MMTDDEIIVYALAHLYATIELPNGDDEHRVYELLIERGTAIGIDIPYGDEYQRAVLHHFDPKRVPDFPLEPTDDQIYNRHGYEGGIPYSTGGDA